MVSRDNEDRLPKDNLHSIKEDDTKVSVFTVPSDKYEAEMICSTISRAPVSEDALVLVPGRRFAIPVKREMRKRRIPYDCKTEVATSGLNAIHHLVKWLKNDKDNFSLRLCLERIVTNPSLEIPFVGNGGIKAKRERTIEKIAGLWPRVISGKTTLAASLGESLVGNSDLAFLATSLAEIRKAWQDEDNQATGRFLELASRVIRPWTSLKRMSEEIEDWVEDAVARNASSGEAVARVLTMEAAKGLGCDQVFLVGMNEGVFPPENLGENELREKQRLMYVSMTRAKKKLLLFSARTREGRFSYQPAPDGAERGVLGVSPFVKWLPEEDVEHEEKWPHK